MWGVKRLLLIGMLICAVIAPACLGQTEKVLSGRELLREVQNKDMGRGKGKGQRPSIARLLAEYTRALDSTLSFIEHYEKNTEFSYRVRGGRVQDKGKAFVYGQVRHDDQRIYCQEYNWGDFNLKYKDLPKDKPYYRCNIADGRDKKAYSNNKWINDSKSSGSAAREPYLREEKVSLSRHFGISYIVGYIGSDERLDAILRKADRISVRKTTENVGGSACFVIDADTRCGRYSVWLDPEHGYHPAKVRWRAKGGDYTHSRRLSKGDTATTYLDNVRFEKVDGIWVPMEADAGCYKVAAKGDFVKEDYHYKRTQIILNPDHDKLGSFDDPLENPSNDPELTNGTRVLINGLPMKCTWQDGKVVDEQGREVDLDALKPREPVSLVGKRLASLEQFGSKLDLTDVEGKRMLVCFWDMNQRPSRNCVQELEKKAEILADRGVCVVLVQAETVDEEKFSAWLAKRETALPVGRIRDNVDEVRRSWGVRSLPWLILTNDKHSVVAEGFNLKELDQKVEEIENVDR